MVALSEKKIIIIELSNQYCVIRVLLQRNCLVLLDQGIVLNSVFSRFIFTFLVCKENFPCKKGYPLQFSLHRIQQPDIIFLKTQTIYLFILFIYFDYPG